MYVETNFACYHIHVSDLHGRCYLLNYLMWFKCVLHNAENIIFISSQRHHEKELYFINSAARPNCKPKCCIYARFIRDARFCKPCQWILSYDTVEMNAMQTQGNRRDTRRNIVSTRTGRNRATTKTLMQITGDRVVQTCNFHNRNKTARRPNQLKR
jgi:hypothetical protein